MRLWVTVAAGMFASHLLRLAQAWMSVSTAPANSTYPHIRIAYVYHNDNYFTPMRHMAAHLGPAGNRTFLPDYEITIDAFPIRPHAAKAPVAVAEILEDDTPTYHAIAGPWSREDAKTIVDVLAAVRMLHVHKGDNPELSDRELYPYTFRVVRAIQGVVATWFHLSAVNGWRAVAGFWGEADVFAASNELADSRNITNYPTLMENGQAAWAAEAAQLALIDLVRSTRLRVVMTYLELPPAWQLFCKVHRAQLLGLQYFISPSNGNGWFLYPFPHLGDCTPDEMYLQVAGHLIVIHTPSAPGLFSLGAVYFPPVGGDFSQVPLTCMPHLTAHTFYNNGENVNLAMRDGAIFDYASMFIYMGMVGSEQDQVCTILLSLHDVLYNKGYSLESIARREEVAFEALLDSTEDVSFIGPTGPFKFTPGTGDPEYLYYILSQQALPGRSNTTPEILGIITFPDGPKSDPVIEEYVTLQWRDGSAGFGPNEAGHFPDCGLEHAELIWDRCEPCPAGKLYDSLLGACRTCPPGQYQNETGAASCIPTSPGWYVENITHPVSPSLCPAGHECPQASMIQPQQCAPGRFAANSGQAACELCEAGRYQEEIARTGCLRCRIEGSTTANIASTSPQECICPSGRFRPLELDYCADCLEGMTCPQGSDMRNLNSSMQLSYPSDEYWQSPYPVAQPGYMTLASEPLQVYLCTSDRHCPGGPPGSCGHHRDSSTRACGDCMEDAYGAGDACHPCGQTSATIFVLIGCFVALFVILTTILVNTDVQRTPAASLMIIAVSGLLCTSIQSLGVFHQVSIPWEEPVKSILDVTQIFSFDLELLKVSCILGVNPIRSFAFRQTIAVIAIPFIGLTLFVKKYAPIVGRRKVRIVVELSNSVGTLYNIFFISIVISAVDPFICYEHPGDSGESVRSAPSLLCFEGGDHRAMIIIGLTAMCLVPLPFLGLCAYGIFMYPHSMVSRSSRNFLLAFRFLFLRFTPQRYYFQIIMLLRSLLLCLVPAIFRAQASTQLLCMCIVLACYVLVVEEMRPWRASLCTTLDIVMTLLLQAVLYSGGLFLEDVPNKTVVATLSTLLLASVGVSGAVLLAYAVWCRVVPSPYYDFFICHHKAHAAAQARYLKTSLCRKRRNLQVFIDSDNLQELDTLFDTVKCRVRHLVAYLTSDTLRRPWCAGEVVTATRASLLITRLHTPSWVPPTEEQCQNPETYIDTVGCNLSEYGIQWDDITAAWTSFLSPQIHKLDLNCEAHGARRFELAAAALLKLQATGPKQAPSLASVPVGGVVVVTAAESDEANASGGVLVSCISEAVYNACEHGIALLADYEVDIQQAVVHVSKAKAAVVMLSADCLRSPGFLDVICAVMQSQGSAEAPLAIPVNTPGFAFLAPAEITEICQAYPSVDVAFNGLCSEYMKSFFKIISVLFPTHASQRALDTQASAVFDRIQGHLKGSWNRGKPSEEAAARMTQMQQLASSSGSRLSFASNAQQRRSRTEEEGRRDQSGSTSNKPALALQSALEDASQQIDSKNPFPPSAYTWTVLFNEDI